MKVGLYSVSYSGAWYPGPGLSMADFIAKAKELGFPGGELGAKRPHASPMDLNERACAQVREALDKHGIELAAVASYNDFTSPVLEHRETQLLMLREQIKVTRDLGAPVLRVFAAWRGVTLRDGLATYDMTRRYAENQYPDVTRLEQWRWVREGLQEAARFAEDVGVTLALQNHEPLIRNYHDMLNMIREVDSPALKACLDAPLLNRLTDADYVRQAVLETNGLQVHSHFGGEFHRNPQGKAVCELDCDYLSFVKALKEIGYTGYLCYEFCHPCLDERHEPAGIDRVHEQVALALEFMLDTLQQADAGPG